MLQFTLLSIFLLQNIIFCKETEDEKNNPMKYKFPFELPDQNQDGFSDNQDFQKAFKNLNLTRFEIS